MYYESLLDHDGANWFGVQGCISGWQGRRLDTPITIERVSGHPFDEPRTHVHDIADALITLRIPIDFKIGWYSKTGDFLKVPVKGYYATDTSLSMLIDIGESCSHAFTLGDGSSAPLSLRRLRHPDLSPYYPLGKKSYSQSQQRSRRATSALVSYGTRTRLGSSISITLDGLTWPQITDLGLATIMTLKITQVRREGVSRYNQATIA